MNNMDLKALEVYQNKIYEILHKTLNLQCSLHYP